MSNFSIFNSFFNLSLVSLSADKGETATGSGSRLPLVISTSINAFDLTVNKANKIIE